MTRTVSLALAILVVVFAIAASGCSDGTTPGGSSKGKGAKTVTFTVTGTAPYGVDITYGNDSSTNYQGPARPPITKTLAVREGALYYHVSAQLSEGGKTAGLVAPPNVTCKVQIGDAEKVGHATGGLSICAAQLNYDPINEGWG